MKPKSTFTFAVALLALASCGQSKQEAVVATVGGRAITAQQFSTYLKLKHIPENDTMRRARALDDYLEREALADAVAQQNALDKPEITAEMREYEKELLISRYFDKVLQDKAGDQAIVNYYNANAAKYEEKRVHVAHILFRTNPKMSAEERKARLTAAQEAYSKLQTGADFATVASEMSEDKVSGSKGGDLGWLRDGSVDPRFSQQVFSLKKGALSQPFETSFGYHIVKVIEPAQSVKRPLDAVRGDIRYQLRAEAKQAEMKKLQGAVKVERKGATASKQTADNATAKRD
ncbi:MAG TPA: peptidylprolyl isomerase [Polyangiales bacterium]|nr:peptidylprolyl isomerase [Polyangiales bacterium]